MHGMVCTVWSLLGRVSLRRCDDAEDTCCVLGRGGEVQEAEELRAAPFLVEEDMGESDSRTQW